MNTETDRELLEWAAKAAGLDVKEDRPGRLFLPHPKDQAFLGPEWSPLTDDGDALRLAVKLKLCIDCVFGAEMVVYFDGQKIKYSDMDITTGNDPYSACRRAIVRAAAEIGKTMK